MATATAASVTPALFDNEVAVKKAKRKRVQVYRPQCKAEDIDFRMGTCDPLYSEFLFAHRLPRITIGQVLAHAQNVYITQTQTRSWLRLRQWWDAGYSPEQAIIEYRGERGSLTYGTLQVLECFNGILFAPTENELAELHHKLLQKVPGYLFGPELEDVSEATTA